MNKSNALKIVKNGIDWLLRMIDKEGRFIYSYYYNKPNKPINDYNILRHAGCCYALFESSKYFKDNIIKILTEHSIKYLLDNYYFNTDIFNKESRSYIIENNIIKTGGLGLSLLALTVTNDNYYIEHAKFIGNYIISIQNENGGLQFQKKKINNGINDSRNIILKSNCDFYEGEVAIGLLKLYHITKIKKYKDSALSLIQFKYLQKKNNEWTRDHWMVQAIELINEPTKDHLIFVKKSIERIMYDPIDLFNNDIFGTIACRTEALFSYLNILNKAYKNEKRKKEKEKILKTEQQIYLKALSFLDMQVKGQLQYGLSKGAWKQNLNSKLLRIDFNQHNICAFIRYLQSNYKY